MMHLKAPENTRIHFFYQGLYIKSFKDLFSVRGVALLSGQLYLFLILLFLGSTFIKYLKSKKELAKLELTNANQKLELVKSRIHPEFLLNTLNTIEVLTDNNQKAKMVVSKLTDLLNFTLYECFLDLIPIKTEIRFLEDYIELEKIRHHNHVKIEYDFSRIDELDYKIAPLLFINFVENAFKHGVNKSRESSWVRIKLVQEFHFLKFEISNSKPQNKKVEHNVNGGKGLLNITRRLQLLYPKKHHLEIYNTENVYSLQLKIDLS